MSVGRLFQANNQPNVKNLEKFLEGCFPVKNLLLSDYTEVLVEGIIESYCPML